MPTVTISKSDFQTHIFPDDSPDASYLDQGGFEERKAQYERGEFYFIGVQAAVTLPIPYGAHYIETTVQSPGLWGIESDSDPEYLCSVFEEESGILTDMLDELRVRVIGQ